jgi:hypothetical protein
MNVSAAPHTAADTIIAFVLNLPRAIV